MSETPITLANYLIRKGSRGGIFCSNGSPDRIVVNRREYYFSLNHENVPLTDRLATEQDVPSMDVDLNYISDSSLTAEHYLTRTLAVKVGERNGVRWDNNGRTYTLSALIRSTVDADRLIRAVQEYDATKRSPAFNTLVETLERLTEQELPGLIRS